MLAFSQMLAEHFIYKIFWDKRCLVSKKGWKQNRVKECCFTMQVSFPDPNGTVYVNYIKIKRHLVTRKSCITQDFASSFE